MSEKAVKIEPVFFLTKKESGRVMWITPRRHRRSFFQTTLHILEPIFVLKSGTNSTFLLSKWNFIILTLISTTESRLWRQISVFVLTLKMKSVKRDFFQNGDEKVAGRANWRRQNEGSNSWSLLYYVVFFVFFLNIFNNKIIIDVIILLLGKRF